MKKYWQLFITFARIGLFTIGGGYAMLPMMQSELVERHGWATEQEMADYYALAQCTPGAIAVNVSTFIGYKIAGVLGGIIATLGLVFPSIVVIVIIAGFLQKFRQSKTVDAVFYGLRPASTALIASAGLTVAMTVLVTLGETISIHWPALILAVVVFIAMRCTPLKKLHPILFIAFSAVVGVVLQF